MIAVVHLVWGPLGPVPVREFLASYRRHAAGAEHELVMLFNGVTSEQRPALEAELEGTEHRSLELTEPVQDLAAYAQAAERLEHERLCFLNSYSMVLARDWLAKLAHALDQPDAGLVGATGSWESKSELVGGGLKHWIYQLVKLRERRREYPRFPNPHIRTTAFMLERNMLLELDLDLEPSHHKNTAYLLESGRHSITRQIQARGLHTVVVGADGHAYDVEDWARSGTFRSREQRNLLVADNRTREWQQASSKLRRGLSGRAWGSRRHGTPRRVARLASLHAGHALDGDHGHRRRD